jgi:hypothetical protein
MATDITADTLATVEALAEIGAKLGLRVLSVGDIKLEFYPHAAPLDDLPFNEIEEDEDARREREKQELEQLHYGSS